MPKAHLSSPFYPKQKICFEKIVQQSGSLKSLKSFLSLSLCLHSTLSLPFLAGKSVEVGFFISFLQKNFTAKKTFKKEGVKQFPQSPLSGEVLFNNAH
jgi:hypothetical protein